VTDCNLRAGFSPAAVSGKRHRRIWKSQDISETVETASGLQAQEVIDPLFLRIRIGKDGGSGLEPVAAQG